MLTILFLAAGTGTLVLLPGACRKEQSTKGLDKLAQEQPAGFPAPLYTFTDNPLTEEGFELGRKLFYDGRLSVDNLHPCASCHQQIAAFGTFEHDRSHGVNNSHTLRNAPVLFNLAWSPVYHWDGQFTSLEKEAEQPITGHLEMGENFQSVIRKIQDDADYRHLFRQVFNNPVIRPEYILKALAQFTGSLISAQSKYDLYKQGQATYTPQELNGYQLFQAKCATCHPEPLFTDFSLRNNGLPVDPLLNDYGLERVSGKATDSLKFKVPSLRNVNISSNYMHDGRFNTLQQCLNHYSTGIQQSATLDPLLKNKIPLTTAESGALIAFLKTLTDSSFLQNPRFAKPQ